MTRDLTELNKLEKYLKEHGYEYDRTDDEGDPVGIANRLGLVSCIDQHQIVVYKDGKRDWDAICQFGSYGAEMGLIEVMGERVVRGGDSVEGYLTADEIIEKLEEWE